MMMSLVLRFCSDAWMALSSQVKVCVHNKATWMSLGDREREHGTVKPLYQHARSNGGSKLSYSYPTNFSVLHRRVCSSFWLNTPIRLWFASFRLRKTGLESYGIDSTTSSFGVLRASLAGHRRASVAGTSSFVNDPSVVALSPLLSVLFPSFSFAKGRSFKGIKK